MRKLFYFSVYILIAWAFYVGFLEPKATFFPYTPGIENRIFPFFLVMIWFFLTTRFHFKKPTDFVLGMFAINLAIPIGLYYLFSGTTIDVLIVLVSLHMAILVFRTFPMPRFQLATMSFGGLGLALTVPTMIAFALLFMSLGTSTLVSSFVNVYSERAEVTEILSSSSALIRYMTVWLSVAFLPLLLLSLYQGKQFILLAALSFLPFLAFAVTTHKAVAVQPFFLLAVAIMLHRNFSLRVPVILYGSVITIGLLFSYFGSDLVSLLFPRRVLFTPAFWSAYYIEFFAELPNVYYSNSILSWLFEYPFEKPYQNLIGEFRTYQENAWANSGIVGTSFMHFGYAGPWIFGAIMGLLFSLFDRSTIAEKNPVFAAILAFMAFNVILTSTDLATGLLSQGFPIFYLLACINIYQNKKASEVPPKPTTGTKKEPQPI